MTFTQIRVVKVPKYYDTIKNPSFQRHGGDQIYMTSFINGPQEKSYNTQKKLQHSTVVKIGLKIAYTLEKNRNYSC